MGRIPGASRPEVMLDLSGISYCVRSDACLWLQEQAPREGSSRMRWKDGGTIVTGGGQGLGRAMADYLAGRGARLALVDLDQQRLDEPAAACKSAGGDARAYICNVANEDQVSNMVSQVAGDFGTINGLINNAGILRAGLLL